jgi:hypothetical protein
VKLCRCGRMLEAVLMSSGLVTKKQLCNCYEGGVPVLSRSRNLKVWRLAECEPARNTKDRPRRSAVDILQEGNSGCKSG